MKKKIILLSSASLFFLTFQVVAQSFQKNSLEHLKVITEVYTHEHDTKSEYRKTEYLLLFFEVDSTGKIFSIHMMSDDNNRDSGYVAFKKLTPTVYKNWQSKEFRGKIIILPVYCMGIEKSSNKENEYLRYKDYPPLFIQKDSGDKKINSQYVLCQQLVYYWPSTSSSH